jgi:hypothetical protein
MGDEKSAAITSRMADAAQRPRRFRGQKTTKEADIPVFDTLPEPPPAPQSATADS